MRTKGVCYVLMLLLLEPVLDFTLSRKYLKPKQKQGCTRMHSSRMRKVRCSGRRRSLPRGGVCLGGCLPRGISAQKGCLPGGVCQGGGGVCPGGVSTQGCVCPRDVCPGGIHIGTVYTPQTQRQPPLVDRMTDTCENITFLQLLLRMVNIFTIKWMFSEAASNCVSKFRSNKN